VSAQLVFRNRLRQPLFIKLEDACGTMLVLVRPNKPNLREDVSGAQMVEVPAGQDVGVNLIPELQYLVTEDQPGGTPQLSHLHLAQDFKPRYAFDYAYEAQGGIRAQGGRFVFTFSERLN
jgi:hypothetical protein